MTLVAFRADASVDIGTGHIYRCLALADALRARGIESQFIHRLHRGHLADVIRARGYRCYELQEPAASQRPRDQGGYAAWIGASEAQDAQQTVAILRQMSATHLVADHYGLGAGWESFCRDAVGRVVVIDDLANRSHVCDILVDQNYFTDPEGRYGDLVNAECLRLCGPRFALLAAEYARARLDSGIRTGPVRRILVFFGGSDPRGLTELTLDVLAHPRYASISVDVVVGRNAPQLRALSERALAAPNVSLHAGLPTLAPLMQRADLAIGAGGTSSWERCCLGVPTIVTVVAENQREPAKALARAGACIAVGPVGDDEVERAGWQASLASALDRFFAEPGFLGAVSEASWLMGDGSGASLVAEAMVPTPNERLRLRQASTGDCLRYWQWASDPRVRSSSHNSAPISWTTHKAWFAKRTNPGDANLWLLETPGSVPVGQFRAEVVSGTGVIGFSVDHAFRGRGLSRELLRVGARAWSETHPGLPLIGEVKRSNVASLRAFESAGCYRLAERSRPGVGDEVVTFTYSPSEHADR